jgi:outer membrane protein assembly factor BamB
VLLAASAMACASAKLGPPPALFPATTAWKVSVGEMIDGPLATDGTHVFVATRDGLVHALDIINGSPFWTAPVGPGLLAAAPGILAVRREDGTLTGIDPETGASRWKSASGIEGDLPPAIDADRVLVAGAGLAAVEADTGRILWKAAENETVIAPPAASASCLLTVESNSVIRCRDRTTGNSLWTIAVDAPVVASPLMDDRGRVMVGTTARGFLALRAQDGDSHWRWKLGADVRDPAVLFRDQVLFASYEAVLYSITRGNGHITWRAPLPSRPLAAPLLLGSAVLVACHETEVVGFDARTGRRLGLLKTPAETRTAPVLVGGRLVQGLQDHSVVALTLDLSPAREEAVGKPGGKAKAKKKKKEP